MVELRRLFDLRKSVLFHLCCSTDFSLFDVDRMIVES